MDLKVHPRDLEAEEMPCSVTITLSERNLITMLAKGRREGSARRIEREIGNGHFLRLIAQTDNEHYQDRLPGIVHPSDDPDEAIF